MLNRHIKKCGGKPTLSTVKPHPTEKVTTEEPFSIP